MYLVYLFSGPLAALLLPTNFFSWLIHWHLLILILFLVCKSTKLLGRRHCVDESLFRRSCDDLRAGLTHLKAGPSFERFNGSSTSQIPEWSRTFPNWLPGSRDRQWGRELGRPLLLSWSLLLSTNHPSRPPWPQRSCEFSQSTFSLIDLLPVGPSWVAELLSGNYPVGGSHRSGFLQNETDKYSFWKLTRGFHRSHSRSREMRLMADCSQ